MMCSNLAVTSMKEIRTTMLLCLALCIVLSSFFVLVRGEVRTQFHKRSMERFSDMQGYARHSLNGTWNETHPAYRYYGEKILKGSIKVFGPSFIVFLVKSGMSFESAVALMGLIIRTFFGLGISLLIYAACHKRYLALLSVFFAYCLPWVVLIYGYSPKLAITGIFTTSIFLTSCSLCLLGFWRLAFVCWLFQFWVHPITFICWSPVFLSVSFTYHFKTTGISLKYQKCFWGLLVIVPSLLGLLAGLGEHFSLIPIQGDDFYWALLRVRGTHSAFWYTPMYYYPLNYFSQVVALFLISFSRYSKLSPLHIMNIVCALWGLGIGLMYATCVETEFSVIACMGLPLRFQCVMFPLILANIFHSMFCLNNDRSKESFLATGFGALMLFPKLLNPLMWTWMWALGQSWLQSDRKRGGFYLGCGFTGLIIIIAYLLFAPSHVGIQENAGNSLFFMKTAGILFSILIFSLICRVHHRLMLILLCMAIIFMAYRELPPKPLLNGFNEVKAIVKGIPENSDEKDICDWFNNEIPPGTPVLSTPSLYLHTLTHIRSSINSELIGSFIYAPHLTKSLVDELQYIYGIDVIEWKKNRRRWKITRKDWIRARDRVLKNNKPGRYSFRYIVEYKGTPASKTGEIVYVNKLARVYRVPSVE